MDGYSYACRGIQSIKYLHDLRPHHIWNKTIWCITYGGHTTNILLLMYNCTRYNTLFSRDPRLLNFGHWWQVVNKYGNTADNHAKLVRRDSGFGPQDKRHVSMMRWFIPKHQVYPTWSTVNRINVVGRRTRVYNIRICLAPDACEFLNDRHPNQTGI